MDHVLVYPGDNPELKCNQQTTTYYGLCEVDPGLCLNWIQQATNQMTTCPDIASFTTTDVPNLYACKVTASALGGDAIDWHNANGCYIADCQDPPEANLDLVGSSGYTVYSLGSCFPSTTVVTEQDTTSEAGDETTATTSTITVQMDATTVTISYRPSTTSGITQTMTANPEEVTNVPGNAIFAGIFH